ncbi:putative C6 transcription factor [Aspergillus chevalieri]|uniref:Xylanolytic transcriptional activator regulatory domain-containing protein n=1 Tax=Aspergillus chevalieri TaxID=182096 RepID=A0A7R7VXV6_ASPCH|nr:uncharacterized protein ACHE_80188A [Aspergillus chevalieri]BCR92288.1 hypothetical protein ACHE_80188A [Aspergillus chevalieri]
MPDQCSYASYMSQWRDVDLHEKRLNSTPPVLATSASNHASLSSGMHVFDSRNRVTKPASRQDEMQELRGRVKALEHAIARQGAPIHTPDTLGDLSDAGRPDGVAEVVESLPDQCFRGSNGGTRYVGRSNYALFMSLFPHVGGFLHRESKNKNQRGDMEKLKHQMWSRERQNHQRTYRDHAFRLEEMVPARPFADQLVHLYLSTFETTHRILHYQEFMRQYEAYWTDPMNADTVFLAKLLAVMAVGSSFYSPETKPTGRESMHQTTSRWIMAVQSWVTSVFVGANINYDLLQIQCLLMLARQIDATDGDITWIASGSLTRTALTMGLHRNPRRFRHSKFWAEMRRRLWATIVELDLQSSADGGMRPSIDLEECDCDAPSNFNDSDLEEDMAEDPAPKAGVSDGYFQAVLSRSLPVRIKIMEMVNSLKFTLTYDEALRMSDMLIRHMEEGLAAFEHGSGMTFAKSLYSFTMRRYLLILHRPFYFSVLQSPKYTYSRKICLESSLHILSMLEEDAPHAHMRDLAPSMFRHEFFYAAMTVCAELQLQMEETSPGGQLTDLVRSQQTVMMRTVERMIQALQSRVYPNGKGGKAYIFLCMVFASVKAKLNGEDVHVAIGRASEEVLSACKAVMDFVEDRDKTPSVFDPVHVFPIDFSDLSALDFGTLFDLSDGPEWNGLVSGN